MSGRTTIQKLFVLLILLLGVVTLGIAKAGEQDIDKQSGAAASNKADGKQKSKKLTGAETHPAVDPSQYVGAETCKACHEDVAKGYDKGPHWKTTLAKHQGPQWQGCEACHGPGKEHAESADPSKIIRFPEIGRAH